MAAFNPFSAIGPLLGIFGGDNDIEPSSASSYNVSGYGALPQQGQNAYNRYFDIINSIPLPKPQQGMFSPYTTNPNDPFASNALFRLQQANPEMSVNPTGLIEPFNQYQREALMQLGNPNPYSEDFLKGYTNPFQTMVTDRVLNEINRQAEIDRSNIVDRASRINSKAFYNSALGTELAQNTDNKNRLIADIIANLGFQGLNNALDLRRSSLADKFNAGTAIQNQNQAALGFVSPYTQASTIAPLFSAFPNSSYGNTMQRGATPLISETQGIAPNNLQRFGSLLSANAKRLNNFFNL